MPARPRGAGRVRTVAYLALVGLTVPTGLAGCSQGGNESTVTLTGTAPPRPQGIDVPQAPSSGGSGNPGDGRGDGGPPRVVDTIASGLAVPWGLDFLPDGDAIVTERDTGRVLRVSGGRRGGVDVLGVVAAATPRGEGGLLGVAVSPDFDQDGALYLYLTTPTDNRVVRTLVQGDGLTVPEVLLDGIPSASIHDGGRLEFGPDGYLYVSTGDAGRSELASDRDSLGGKILRITTDGEPAPGNPFDSPVWSYGHRNVQGLAFDDRGSLWASEFGQDRFDELNRIRSGADYGWPRVEGKGGPEAPRGLTDPVQTWDVAEASPSGLAHVDGSLWMAALRGERLWQVELRRGRAVGRTPYFVGDYGRMRSIALAPDGTLWVTTSNRDGRGDPAARDDRILQVRP